jgi:hypothetical protein
MDTPMLTRRGFLFALGAVALGAPPLARMIETALPQLELYEPSLGLRLVRTAGSGILGDGLLVYRYGFGFDPGNWGGAIAVGHYCEYETVSQGLAALNTIERIRRPGKPPLERLPRAMHVYDFERHYLAEVRSLLTPEQVAFMNRRRPWDRT